jgi:hypothetical protein
MWPCGKLKTMSPGHGTVTAVGSDCAENRGEWRPFDPCNLRLAIPGSRGGVVGQPAGSGERLDILHGERHGAACDVDPRRAARRSGRG